MAHVDALSRIQVLTNQCNDSIVHRIKESQELDPHILSIKALLQKGPYDNYCIKNNILYKFIDGAEVRVIPDEMQHHFIKNAHDKGHFSVKRTLEHIKNKYFIPQLQSKIEKYISNCVTCILKNKKSGKQEGFLHPLVKDDIPLNTYHIDHLGPLATSNKNYKFILAVIDSFTKFVWLYPTKTTSTSEVIKKLDIQKTTFGNPRFLITDRGTTFTSDEFHTYCSEQKLHFTILLQMWHEARKQEKKIRGMMVDYKRRAERRREYYEKIKQDPAQFLQVHGRPAKIHLDPAVAIAADSPATMMPWQGHADNLIDRFDVRAHLDIIPEYNPSKLSLPNNDVAAVAEWYRYRMSSSPVPLKTRCVGQRCTLNLSRAETSSRWCGS
ncbi:hypothetical protein TNCV_1418641 [Trichonephila clavipes]|nr:hypothetical protein TNCV_1418641 [Trichonephila clavipes]